MNELMVLRHAKSDWDAAYDGDHERPLNRRGREAADSVARFLERSGRLPDAVLCSSALRTRQTLDRLLSGGAAEVPTRVVESLYGATVHDWLASVETKAPADARRLLVIGHEPACSAVVERLTGARIRFPTAGLAVVSVPGPWNQVRTARGELLWFLIPRLLA